MNALKFLFRDELTESTVLNSEGDQLAVRSNKTAIIFHKKHGRCFYFFHPFHHCNEEGITPTVQKLATAAENAAGADFINQHRLLITQIIAVAQHSLQALRQHKPSAVAETHAQDAEIASLTEALAKLNLHALRGPSNSEPGEEQIEGQPCGRAGSLSRVPPLHAGEEEGPPGSLMQSLASPDPGARPAADEPYYLITKIAAQFEKIVKTIQYIHLMYAQTHGVPTDENVACLFDLYRDIGDIRESITANMFSRDFAVRYYDVPSEIQNRFFQSIIAVSKLHLKTCTVLFEKMKLRVIHRCKRRTDPTMKPLVKSLEIVTDTVKRLMHDAVKNSAIHHPEPVLKCGAQIDRIFYAAWAYYCGGKK